MMNLVSNLYVVFTNCRSHMNGYLKPPTWGCQNVFMEILLTFLNFHENFQVALEILKISSRVRRGSVSTLNHHLSLYERKVKPFQNCSLMSRRLNSIPREYLRHAISKWTILNIIFSKEAVTGSILRQGCFFQNFWEEAAVAAPVTEFLSREVLGLCL